MEKCTRVQIEVLLTADEKALLDHYVKDHNQRFGKMAAKYPWTLERLLTAITGEAVDKMVRQRSVWAVFKELLPL